MVPYLYLTFQFNPLFFIFLNLVSYISNCFQFDPKSLFCHITNRKYRRDTIHVKKMLTWHTHGSNVNCATSAFSPIMWQNSDLGSKQKQFEIYETKLRKIKGKGPNWKINVRDQKAYFAKKKIYTLLIIIKLVLHNYIGDRNTFPT